jgi:hypothetical protein
MRIFKGTMRCNPDYQGFMKVAHILAIFGGFVRKLFFERISEIVLTNDQIFCTKRESKKH